MASPPDPDHIGPGIILKIFLSYAREDERLKDALEAHLASLKRAGFISSWYEGNTVPGDDWLASFQEHLQESDIILLLISADFIKSDYYLLVLPKALEKYEKQEARVIPILLRPTDFKDLPIARFQPLPADGRALTLQENQDAAWEQIVGSLRSIIKEQATSLIGGNLAARGNADEKLPLLHHLPRRNPFFTGHKSLLSRLHKEFASSRDMRIQTLYGLGGCGKTQVALEYAYASPEHYQAIFWIAAGPQNDLLSQFVTIAEALDLPGMPQADQSQTMLAILHWLRGHERWLLIFDNVENVREVLPFLPETGQGHVLLTTRSPMTHNRALPHRLDPMSEQEGARFLLRQAKIRASTNNLRDAKAITRRLGGLPLALDQAAIYLEETGSDLLHYLDLFEKQRARLLRWRGQDGLEPGDHQESVMTTMSLALEKVQQVYPQATLLLQLCACFHTDAIPYELLLTGTALLHPEEPSPFSDAFLFDRALAALRACSLIQQDKKTVSIHVLVRDVLLVEMDAHQQRQWAEAAVRTICQWFPSGESSTWSLCQRYFSHARACLEHVEQWQMSFAEVAHLCGRVGYYLFGQSRYREALEYYQQGLQHQAQTEEDLTTALLLNHLGDLHLTLKHLSAAETYIQRALILRKRFLGPAHSAIAQSLNSLAGVAHHQRAFDQAEALYQQALAMQEAVESTSAESVQTLSNLGLLEDDRGRLDRAEKYYQQALSLLERSREAMPLTIARLLHNLARVYRLQQHFSQAETLASRALTICEEQLGGEQTQTAITLTGLGLLYLIQEQDIIAEPLFVRAIGIWETLFGLDYSRLIAARHGLAQIFLHRYKLDEAYEQIKLASQIQDQTARSERTGLLLVEPQLAAAYEEKTAYAQAEAVHQLHLMIYQRMGKTNHPDLAAAREAYELFLRRRGREEEANDLHHTSDSP